ncbi:hypothetical protein [Salmonella enterica]|uniref:hypothetical protein n=1 Tax=Salmonella enterica TaxID=28901 RepID=UPI00398C505D
MLSPGLEALGEALPPACQIAGDGIWPCPAYQDAFEHLQNIAFIMVWELWEKLGCEDEILPDRASSLSPGYCAARDSCSAPAAFLWSLAVWRPAQVPATGLDFVLLCGSSPEAVPLLYD